MCKLRMDALMDLADKDMQIEHWVIGKGGFGSSFDETCNNLFDDVGFVELFERGDVFCSPEITKVLKQLYELTLQVDWRRLPSEIIDDPKMVDIRLLARRILQMASMLSDQSKILYSS